MRGTIRTHLPALCFAQVWLPTRPARERWKPYGEEVGGELTCLDLQPELFCAIYSELIIAGAQMYAKHPCPPGCSDLRTAVHARFKTAFPEEMQRYDRLRQRTADPDVA